MKKYFITIFVLFIFFAHNIAHNIKDKSISNHKLEKTNEAYLKYLATYNAHKEFANIVFRTIIQHDDIINAFENKNRNLLYDLLKDDYKELEKFNVKQLHFHLKNNDSFLRMHRPNKFGDNLSEVRGTVKYVNKYQKPIDGFEEGKVFNGFRYVFPVYNKNNTHIGSVEISFSALLFIEELNESYAMKCNLYINKQIVNKKLFTTEKTNYLQSIFDNYYNQKTVINYLKNNKLEKTTFTKEIIQNINSKIKDEKIFSIYNNDKLITFIFLQNPISKKVIGFLTIEANDTIKSQKEKASQIILLLIITIMLIVLIIIYRNIKSKEKIKLDLHEKLIQNTKLKDLSKKLKENLQTYSNHIIYSKTDLRGNIIEVSDAFCKISQYTKDELIGITHSIIRSKNISKSVYDDMWNIIKSNNIWEGEIQNISKNGNMYWISSIIYAQYNSSNEKIGYIAIARNITNTKKLERQHERLMQAEKLASMRDMITNISHQWRQPLSVISTSATTLIVQNEINNLSKEDITKTCTFINDRTKFLSKTIDNFKNYTNDNGIIEETNLSELVVKFKELVQFSIDKQNITFIQNINENIQIDCLKNDLIQCFINLFNNSKDAYLINNIEEKIFIMEAFKDDNNIVITIRDNAKGISSKIINKVFEPYFTTKHQSQGTGLGLHMTYNLIVQNMHGNIEVSNKEYEYKKNIYTGACFKIRL